MQRLSKRIANISPSATMAIDDKAKAMTAAGEDVISFGAGEPDFPTPDHIVAAAVAAAADERNHHYTSVAGHPELRSLIAARATEDLGTEIDSSQVVVTNGAKHAVFNALAALVDPGDEVLVPAPYWVTYPETVRWLGGTPVPVPADESSNFHVDADALEQAATERTKALLFSSPTNPTGAVYSAAEVRSIGAWAADRGMWIVSDDIYQDLVYGGAEFTSIVREIPEVRDRTIVINGVSKSFAMTGWRVGWLVAPADVAAAVTRLQGHATSNVSNVAQAAAAAALASDASVVEEMRLAFDRRRRRMYDLLLLMPGVECTEPQGAFYAFPSVQGTLGKSLCGRRAASSLELADLLLDEAGVAVVPGEAFGAPGYLRFSYALADAALEEGLSRMFDVLNGH